MSEIPPQMLHELSSEEVQDTQAWWASLAVATQSELVALWDRRRDDCFFGSDRDESGTRVPCVIGGRFIPHDDAWGVDEWYPSYFEHLLQHPELVIVDEPLRRTFHICTQHAAARACLAAGRIPADFQCPLDATDCPMRKLLSVAGGQAVQLVAQIPALQNGTATP